MTARSPIDYLCLSSGSIIIIRLDLEEINSAIEFGRISDSLQLLDYLKNILSHLISWLSPQKIERLLKFSE